VLSAAGRFLRDRYSSVDPRSLGLFRIALGILLCADVANRWWYAPEFFSNDGLLPSHYALFRPQLTYSFSIYHAFSSVAEVRFAFALTFLVFACLLVGFRTRLASVVALVCVTSLGSRNVLVEHGGHVVANLLMLFAVFLPLGRRFSVDAVLASLRARRETRSEELNELPAPSCSPVVSLAVLAFLLQWSALYFLNAVQKTGPAWSDGTALHYFFHQDRLVTQLGLLGRGLPGEAVWLLSKATLVFEYAIPMLLLFPFFQSWTRRAALLCAVMLHGGIAATTQIWHFSAATSVFFLMFLGPRDWELAARWFGSARRSRQVVVDPGSPFWFDVARVLARLDPSRRLRFLGSPAAEPGGAAEPLLVMAPGSGRCFRGSRALAEAASALPLGVLALGWLRVPGIDALADRVLAAWAERRARPKARPGRPAGAVRKPASWLRGAGSFAREATVLLFLFAIATQLTIDNPWLQKRVPAWRPRWVVPLIEYPRLFQGWLMFAPDPPYDDGRLVVNGRTVDGRLLDPLTGREPDFGHGPVAGWRRQRFWTGYEGAVIRPQNIEKLVFLQRWVARHHLRAGRPQDQLAAFEIWWVPDRSPPPGQREPTALPAQKLFSTISEPQPASPSAAH